MAILIHPSSISGTITAPPSKSLTHRSIIMASLAEGVSEIVNPLISEDTMITINALTHLGIKSVFKKNIIKIYGKNGYFYWDKKTIYLGNSGTSLRLLLPVAVMSVNGARFTGSDRLAERPQTGLINALSEIGATIDYKEKNIFPIKITPGKLNGKELVFKNAQSSQYISALLIAAPMIKEGLKISAENTVSLPYIDLTTEIMKRFGINVKKSGNSWVIKAGQKYSNFIYTVTGDFSSASYFFAAAAMGKSKIRVHNLDRSQSQADKILLTILRNAGCSVKYFQNTITLEGNYLKPLNLNCRNFPDLVPALSVISAVTPGKSELHGIANIRNKESDRINAICQNLTNFKIRNEEEKDMITIYGGIPKSALINTYGDHRIAMSMTILALNASGESIINDGEAVSKSYPTFFNDLINTGARLEVV
jgi:3-phosphoshikimate 1-carboxyvinyltransferase